MFMSIFSFSGAGSRELAVTFTGVVNPILILAR
jgi:hypothetical protein